MSSFTELPYTESQIINQFFQYPEYEVKKKI